MGCGGFKLAKQAGAGTTAGPPHAQGGERTAPPQDSTEKQLWDLASFAGVVACDVDDDPPEAAAAGVPGGGWWFWGHSSDAQRPPGCSKLLIASTALLPAYNRDMARWKLCPSYPEHMVHHAGGRRCPFAGSAHLYQRHEDCERMLKEHCALWESGKIDRRNELGLLELDDGLFPSRTLGLGNPIEVHQIQREQIVRLIDRFPGRGTLLHEVRRFMRGRTRIEFPLDVDVWWSRMMWKYAIELDVDDRFAREFVKFRNSWLTASVLHGKQISIADLTLSTDDILRDQAKYRDKITPHLFLEVPKEHREVVAQAVLEMMVFAGGISVPSTITCAVACMHGGLFKERVTEQNVEAFIYEVTRLFPAVQGFPWWKDGERTMLHLAASLRDPKVWGPDADKFTLKDLSLYREKHLGFANAAKSTVDYRNSRFCPAIPLALDAAQAFALVLSSWTYRHAGVAESAWRPADKIVPRPKPDYWKPFVLERDGVDLGKLLPAYQSLMDNNQTGEAQFADFTPEQFQAFVDKIDADGDGVPDVLGKTSLFTRVFYKISLTIWVDYSKITRIELPRRPPTKFSSKDSVLLPIGGITMPTEDEHWPGPPVLESLAKRAMLILNSFTGDSVHESLAVTTAEQRREAIFIARSLFVKEDGGTYLPKSKDKWEEFASDRAQGLLALCSVGQLDLKRNADPKRQDLGELVVDPLSRTLGAIPVRDAKVFERIGAAAFFNRGESGELCITAIDWRHADRVVRPGDPDWEHAKFAWRCNIGIKMTAVDHLVWCHWIVANAFSTSAREAFRPDHPIRRLLHVHFYDTAAINYSSFWTLYPEHGFLHRMTPWEHSGVVDVFKAALSAFQYQTWPQAYKEWDLPEDLKEKAPMWEDGLTVWRMFREFYGSYVDLYYASDEDVLADPELQQYWKFSTTPQYTKGLPPLSKDALIDQITHAAFWVTAHHELVGGAIEFVTDPSGLFFQVRPGETMTSKEHMIQCLALTASTGSPMPLLSSDWSHVLDLGPGAKKNRFEEVKLLFRKFQVRMREVSAEIAEKNKTRPHTFNAFDPMTFECSVSL